MNVEVDNIHLHLKRGVDLETASAFAGHLRRSGIASVGSQAWLCNPYVHPPPLIPSMGVDLKAALKDIGNKMH